MSGGNVLVIDEGYSLDLPIDEYEILFSDGLLYSCDADECEGAAHLGLGVTWPELERRLALLRSAASPAGAQ